MYTTDKTLLRKIKDGDEMSWDIFYTSYRPFIYSIAQRSDLRRDECEELVQQVMVAIFKGGKHFQYDPDLGKFRNYLAVVVRNQIGELFRRRPQGEVTYLETLDQRANCDFDGMFLAEYRKHILKMALDELRERLGTTTFEAFHLSVIQGRKVSEVAAALELSEGSIYVYKERCLKMLRQIVAEINEADRELCLKNVATY